MRVQHSVAILIVFLTGLTAVAQERPRLPQGAPGTVTLPVADYDRLVDRAGQPERRPDPPPVDAVVGRADLRARVISNIVRGTLQLEGEVFQRGAVKVPLIKGATLLDARADGRPLPLLHEEGGHAAVLRGPSVFSVTLEWAAPLTPAPGRASFVLPSPAGGTISASVDLPGDPAEVRVEPGLVTRRQTAAGRTTVDVTLQPGRPAQVSWSVRESTTGTAPVESRTLADIKSLITIGEADLRLVALVDITVVSGAPRTFEVRLPSGFEVAGITGSSLDTTDPRPGAVVLTVRDPSRRRHQFLINLEQSHSGGSFKVETSFPTVTGVQREIGETAVEGIGTMEVTASGDEHLRRMDVRETNASLRSLARQPLLAAFRYQRRPSEARALTLDVKRFADAPVIAAAAERAVATTLVTGEGRTLTEIALWMRNRAQPFMKVTLPPGATMLSADVAGEPAKPVVGVDGIRVPLLRVGFRPDGAYSVSFVYLHAGQPFAKRGHTQMALPRLDVPVSILEWELFLPDRFSAKPIGGNVIPSSLIMEVPTPVGAEGTVGRGSAVGPGSGSGVGLGVAGGTGGGSYKPGPAPVPGQIIGRITEPSGAVLPGVTVIVTGPNSETTSTTTDEHGMYGLYGLPSGPLTVTSELAGFARMRRTLVFDQRPRQVDFHMQMSAVTETVTVTADAPVIDTRSSSRTETLRPGAAAAESERRISEPQAQPQAAPSQNVINLQRRVAGVLPVRMEVPRSGTSYRFVRPLVLDEETTVSLRYKTR
jgi:hypothetical protein